MRHIFTILVTGLSLAGCAGEFNPDLGGSSTSGGSTSEDTLGTTNPGKTGSSTGIPDETENSTGVSDETGSTGDTAIPDGCGDGEAQGEEECDGLDLRGAECTAFDAPANGNYSGGQLACNDDCTFDLSSCTYCGDDSKNHPSEECDGTDLGPPTCIDEGFDGGELGCSDQCSIVISACESCEGDIMGMYGTPESTGCPSTAHGAGNDYWSVCLPNQGCTMDSECADPDLAICANQPVCDDTAGGAARCLLLCTGDEECPGGMVCHDMVGNGMFCMWAS